MWYVGEGPMPNGTWTMEGSGILSARKSQQLDNWLLNGTGHMSFFNTNSMYIQFPAQIGHVMQSNRHETYGNYNLKLYTYVIDKRTNDRKLLVRDLEKPNSAPRMRINPQIGRQPLPVQPVELGFMVRNDILFEDEIDVNILPPKAKTKSLLRMPWQETNMIMTWLGNNTHNHDVILLPTHPDDGESITYPENIMVLHYPLNRSLPVYGTEYWTDGQRGFTIERVDDMQHFYNTLCHIKECVNEAEFKCSNCDIIAYCGSKCQKKDWRMHKYTCKK